MSTPNRRSDRVHQRGPEQLRKAMHAKHADAKRISRTHVGFEETGAEARGGRSHSGELLAAGLGLGVLAIAGAVAFFMMRGNSDGDASAESPAASKPSTVEEIDKEVMGFPPNVDPPTLAVLRARVAEIFALPTLDERLPQFLHADEVSAKAREYYASHPLERGLSVGFDQRMDVLAPAGGGPAVFVVSATHKLSSRLCAFKQVDGRYLLDWECFVALGEMDWDDLLKKRPDSEVRMRVRMEESDYFKAPFEDRSQHTAYRIIEAHGVEEIYGYARRGSDAEFLLSRALEKSRPRGRYVNIRLRFPKQPHGPLPAAEITEVVGLTWLTKPPAK